MFAATMLAELPLGAQLGLPADTLIRSIRFETRAPVDDILVETTTGGFVAIQVKTRLDYGKSPTSVFGSVVDQFARHWALASGRAVEEPWARPPDPERDRLVLVIGRGSSNTVIRLEEALGSGIRAGVTDAVLEDVRTTFLVGVEATWQAIGYTPAIGELDKLLAVVRVIVVDTAGADRQVAVEQLRGVAADRTDADALFVAAVDACLAAMRGREGLDAPSLRSHMVALGLRLQAPASMEGSVVALRAYSQRVAAHLQSYEDLGAGAGRLNVPRDCMPDVVAAAEAGSMVVIGEPGAGKSAVLSALSRELRARDAEVIELAVDRLPVTGLDALSRELGLQAPVLDVLQSWPGIDRAYLVIDALDATRGGPSEAVFRALIDGVLSIEGGRWHVIASIRTFDLRMGRQFRQLFSGQPVSALTDPNFPDVRHVSVPVWTPREFTTILAASPGLALALESAGEKLTALVKVPFNTRLLADLLSRGTDPSSFSGVTSQSRLLGRYWQDRVEAHGTQAEASLRQLVRWMVEGHTLRMPRQALDPAFAGIADMLEGEGVLARPHGDRFLAFRHHILFDFAASRLYLDPYDLEQSIRTLSSESGAALALAQALAFALDETWEQDPSRRAPFWQVAGALLESDDTDPVAKTVAARLGSELPVSAADIDGILLALGPKEEQVRGRQMVRHVLGALSVRSEDKLPIRLEPWLALAVGLADRLRDSITVAWALRLLLHILVPRVDRATAEAAELGVASRILLCASLDAGQDQYVASAIGYVAKTYATDPLASRNALARLLQADRLAIHAPEEMTWLAEGAPDIEASDPAFLAEIYRVIFNFQVSDQTQVPMGSSQILPLTSSRRQNFEMARYALKEHFPTFLARHPEEAIDALSSAVAGQISEEGTHLPEEGLPAEVQIGGRAVQLVPDRSYIWAHDVENDYADDGEALIQAFVRHVKDAEPDEAIWLFKLLLARAQFAVLWSRLFYLAAARPELLGELAWPFASNPLFLNAEDTLKDAIDAVAAVYPSRSFEERAAFESMALDLPFSDRSNPAAARRIFHQRLFATIGEEHLAMAESRRLATPNPASGASRNERLMKISTGFVPGERNSRLEYSGLTNPSPAVVSIFEQGDEIIDKYELEGERPVTHDAAGMLDAVERLKDAIEEQQLTIPMAHAYASEPIIKACRALVADNGRPLDDARDGLARAAALVLFLVSSPSPGTDKDTEEAFARSAGWGSPAPRVDGAGLLYDLMAIDPALVDQLLPVLTRLLTDGHPAVRLMAVQRLTALWSDRREWMWQSIRAVAEEERNVGVLRYFVPQVLGRLTFAIDEVAPIVHALWGRFGGDAREGTTGKALSEALAELLAALWVWRGHEPSGVLVRSLLDSPTSDEGVLFSIVTVTRASIVAGYGTDNREDPRRRGQALLAQTIESCARNVEAYYRAPADNRDEAFAAKNIHVLDHGIMQIYFAAGVRSSGADSPGQVPTKFLWDIAPLVLRAGDVGSSRTIHRIVELADHGLTQAPELSFAIAAHAILTAGSLHGYHQEAMGADLFVRFIGRCLADQRGLFDDPNRRKQLISCLDVFIEGGWPSARKLLYQLPELLQ